MDGHFSQVSIPWNLSEDQADLKDGRESALGSSIVSWLGPFPDMVYQSSADVGGRTVYIACQILLSKSSLMFETEMYMCTDASESHLYDYRVSPFRHC